MTFYPNLLIGNQLLANPVTVAQGGTGSANGAGVMLCAPFVYAPAQGASAAVLLSVAATALAAPAVLATTVAAGSNGGLISNVAAWASPSAGVLDVALTTGWPVSGTVNVAASGATTAIVTYTGIAAGQLTGCAYVSGSPSGTVATGGAVTLTSGPVLQTNIFVAPASGNVLVTVDCVMQTSTGGHTVMLGLAASGTVTPVIGVTCTFAISGTTQSNEVTRLFYVTGLVAGNSYQLALLASATSGDTVKLVAQGLTSTTIGANSGGPITITVVGSA